MYKLYVCHARFGTAANTHTLVTEFATKEEADFAAQALEECKINLVVVKLYPSTPEAET